MKKILAIALAAVMVLGLATSALAVSWAAPAASTTASPFAVEVVKLGVNTDITGGAYYTVLSDAAAYDYSTIYYAIKLSLPSYADANAYYGNSGFVNGNEVKVTITWTNVAGKSTQVVMVPLASEAQTLWFDGSKFTSTWQQKLAASCGCAESHILSAVANGTKEVSVKACVGAEGKLSDVNIGGCYSVKSEKFYGIVPCVNCKPQNLSGYLFSGDCTAYDVFFSTNSAAKVTGAYVVDKGHKDIYYGGVANAFSDTLYAWQVVGVEKSCTGTCVEYPIFARKALPYYARVNATGGTVTVSSGHPETFDWMKNGYSFASDGAFKAALLDWSTRHNKGLVEGDEVKTYTEKNSIFTATSKVYVGTANYAKEKYAGLTSVSDTKDKIEIESTISGGIVAGSSASLSPWEKKVLFEGYKYDDNNTVFVYGDTYTVKATKSDSRLFQQTSATTINCDTNEAAYLNTLNHLYSLLGFTYADIAAGNVYMNDAILLANFGFSTSICDTATWGAYTAAITVAPVTEVPATGVASFAGFAMIAVAAAAAAVAKKRD